METELEGLESRLLFFKMNPRNGLIFEGGIDSRVSLEINTPDNSEKEDWVLILEK